MQKILLLILVGGGVLYGALPEAGSEGELLHARRIIEFWRDHENAFATAEIEQFLQAYPWSSFNDYFYGILGDMALEQGRFVQALASYNLIQSSEIKNQVKLKRWNALYQLKQYESLYQEIAPQLAIIQEEEGRFYFAEAALREALAMEDSPATEVMRERLFSESLAIYQTLQKNPRFEEHAKLAMAEIYRHTGQLEEAALLYVKIAQEQKSPQTLYHAAVLLSQCGHEEEACEIFAKLAKSGSIKASEAAYQWLQLIAKYKNWDLLLKEQRLFLSTLQTIHLPAYYFYYGMLAYDEKRFEEAVPSLQESLKGGLKPPYDRGALLALLSSAKELAHIDVVNWAFNLLQDRYPDEIERAALLKAVCYCRANEDQAALSQLCELMRSSQDYKIAEEAYLEACALLIKTENWSSAYLYASEFLRRFPRSEHYKKMVALSVDLSLRNLSNPNGASTLAENLKRALNIPALYSPDERLEKQFLLAKCYFKLDQISAAHSLLIELLNHPYESAELHYLLTGCYLKEHHPEQIIEHGERVLELDPFFQEAPRIHLYLFNAYLELSQQKQQENLAYLAANHLYEVLDILPISLENQLWLAHTYAKQKKSEERAMRILEGIVLGKEDRLKFYPEEAFLLAKLYLQEREFQKALSILEPLQAIKTSPLVQLHLAIAYQTVGYRDQAQQLLKQLEQASETEIALTAKLHYARLLLAMEGSDRSQPLKSLKELWIRKELASEPVHLEAAMDYVYYFSHCLAARDQLELMREIKEHFTSENDICSKDYHEARSQNLEKDLIYQGYMRLLDAEILAMEAAQLERGSGEYLSKARAAHALFSTLVQGKYAVTPYVIEKATREVN